MITLSDLTMLLLGFLVCWYVTNKATTPNTTRPVVAKNTVNEKPAVETPAAKILSRGSWQGMQQELREFIAKAGLSDAVSIKLGANEIVVSLKDTVPFGSGKATLRTQALPVLEKVVSLVIAEPNLSVAISGHTDSLKITTAQFPSNWELSTARASRVARYLVERGVHPARIAVQGFADRRPRAPNSDPVNRRANRRVEIRLYHDVPLTSGGFGPVTTR
ncbi:MAG TPA: OmpA family protein [Terriglobales bacterium]|jgi:chemotaxis protein MotB|nr:OmpA family protein [Terriglobales bacterium]